MAKTAFATSDALTKKLWEEQLFRDALKESYFTRFMGMTPDSLVYVKEDLVKSKGDEITFGIRMRLSGTGVTSGQVLEGNEEKLTTFSYKIALERYRHAVRDAGALDRQRVAFSIDEESVAALKGWGGEKIDELCFDAVTAAPTKTFFGGAATSKATLTTADKVTPALISKAKAFAKVGGGRTQPPLRPVRIEGRDYYVFVIHPDVMFDLKQDATFAQAYREAHMRGSENPIFQGSQGIWDGVVIHEHENVPIFTNGGAGGNVPGASNIFMGAQAICYAWGERPKVIAETFDYEEEHGYAWAMTARAGKPKFNSKDYGSIEVMVARTQIN